MDDKHLFEKYEWVKDSKKWRQFFLKKGNKDITDLKISDIQKVKKYTIKNLGYWDFFKTIAIIADTLDITVSSARLMLVHEFNITKIIQVYEKINNLKSYGGDDE